MAPRARRTSAQLLAEIEAERSRSDGTKRQRLVDIDAQDTEDPFETFMMEATVVIDHAVAQAIRNQRSGQGKTLREMGYSAVAEALGY